VEQTLSHVPSESHAETRAAVRKEERMAMFIFLYFLWGLDRKYGGRREIFDFDTKNRPVPNSVII
jgi:hypothetical protein